MKTRNSITVLFFAMILTSCDSFLTNPYVPYIDYLKEKAIVAIHIQDSILYVFTSRYCDTCKVSPEMSYYPTIEEWVVIKDSSYYCVTPDEFSGLPVEDHHGRLYIAKGNSVYRLNNTGIYDMLLNTGNYSFSSFSFDRDDNIWFYSYDNGIAYWDKYDLTVYNDENSEYITDRIHGLAVDSAGIVWVALDYEGLLKIENDTWSVISNSEIPGLKETSYLRGPYAETENGIWFEVFNPDTTSNILHLENGNWIYEFPEESGFSHIMQDSRGVIWSLNNVFTDYELDYTSLKYFDNSSWISLDVSDVSKYIFTVNADDNKVYIGTANGMVEREH